MLRIKNNIDLIELEKYGFEEKEHIYELIEWWFEYPDDEWAHTIISIDKELRTIEVNYGTELALDTLFDMFNDKLIEK